jgi:hypothetical protein
MDLDRGWSVERLDLEPLAVAHAAELAPTTDLRDGEVRWIGGTVW